MKRGCLFCVLLITSSVFAQTADVPQTNPQVRKLERRLIYAIGLTKDLDEKTVDESKKQLKETIDSLVQLQFFNIVPCNGDAPLVDAVAAAKQGPLVARTKDGNSVVRGVVIANPDNKRRAYTYIDQMKAADRVLIGPVVDQLIADPNWEVCHVLLFDVPSDYEAELKRFTKENKGKVRVNVILAGPATDEKKKTLQRWPDMTGGILKIVDLSTPASPTTQPSK